MSREPADIFVCSLSVADTLGGFFLLYNTTYNLINYQLYYECAFRMGLVQILGLASVYHMAALTVDRYVKIAHPYHYPTACNRMFVFAVCIVIWSISTIIGLLPLFGWKNEQKSGTVGVVIMLDFSSGLGDRTTVEKGTLLLYASSTAFINSLVNPIIYAFKITSVRLRFRALFCRKYPRPDDMDNSLTEASGYVAPKTRTTFVVTSCISEIDLTT
ncbi:G-protein coupled receptor 12-like [Haliotis asinina]|uniref:G-protein coupled receptor 12-like n=1 Tax=Haliotis asinina TaxID=109174 RepID=UPI0035325AD3